MARRAVGLQTSLWNNNLKSFALLFMLPTLLGAMIWVIMHVLLADGGSPSTDTLSATLIAMTVAGVWFVIAYFYNERLVMRMVGATQVDRREYPELYNLTENLSIAAGLRMPALYIMETPAMNAFAAGARLDKSIICVTRGLLEKLDKSELEAVLAHEMSHILHRDVRLITVATIFVGIIAFIAEMILRGGLRSRSKSNKNQGPQILIILGVAVIGYVIAILSKFAISRSREYMADAGSVVLTKDKEAMIRALEKISGHSEIEDTPSDVKFMLFDNTQAYLGLFQTHPPIEKRIQALRGY